MPREQGGPVPYEAANVPQAWAAAVPVLALQLFLGLLPDAPRRRLHLTPWLPSWLDQLEVADFIVGGQAISMRLVRDGSTTSVAAAQTHGLQVVRQMPPAALWGQVR
jgi:hypothetical protein